MMYLKLFEKLRRYKDFYLDKKSAMSILRNIEKVKGKTDTVLLNKCDEYAVRVLGSKKYVYWLYIYAALNNEFKEGWISRLYYLDVLVPRLQGKYGEASELKGLSQMFFKSDLFPDLLFYINDIWYDKNYKILNSSEVKKIITNDEQKYIYKPDYSAMGNGIKIFKGLDFNLEKIKHSGNGVLQSYIKQNAFFDCVMPNSVATIRMVTILGKDGTIELKGAYLRVGRDRDTHVLSSSNVRIPISLEDGVLCEKGYLSDWTEVKEHPDTKFIFKDKRVPEFFECKKSVIMLHEKIPFSHIVGWDVTVDNENRVKIMEWNGWRCDIKFIEATQGPIFKDMNYYDLWR